MARFTQVTFNTGSISAGSSATFNPAIVSSRVNVGKVKIVPSGATVGYYAEIYKKNTFLSVDRQYSTKDKRLSNFYDPTDLLGNEVLEGFVLPYEDLDASSQIHVKVYNQDAVSRSYDVTLWIEDANAVLAGNIKTPDLSGQLPGTSITLPDTPVSFMGLWRQGIMQEAGGVDYTRSGSAITLIIPGEAGERLRAIYLA